MSERPVTLRRREVLAGGLILPLIPRLAWAAPRNLAFAVFRNGSRIGEHHVVFAGDGPALTATTDAVMTVKLGPVPLFRYHHHAVETRHDGVFASMQTATTTNGKAEQVEAERTAGGVRIDGSHGEAMLSRNTNPLNHWDQQIFAGPLFNPQTGKLMKVRTAKVGPGHWTIRGEAEIDDFYDESGAWRSLTGKLDDGSRVEYRRI
ncbi:MAG: DUF6134 family protein [Caulobacterales bacterium]|jgi:hypothetical protein